MDFTLILRKMIQTFHEEPNDDILISYLSNKLVETIPSIYLTSRDGIYRIYRLKLSNGESYNCVWQNLIAKGGYNYVYKSQLVQTRKPSAQKLKSVIKITLQDNCDLRVYLIENMIHAILSIMPESMPYVVHMYSPFKLRQPGFPPYKFGSIFANPGGGDLSDFLTTEEVTDGKLCSVVSQIALILYQLQGSLKFQHRDLKADNVLIDVHDQAKIHISCPDQGVNFICETYGMKCLLIDFGMTRLEIGGEYIGCDVYHNNKTFNPHHDLQYFLTTTLEDFRLELEIRAPNFVSWLKDYTKPLMTKIEDRCKLTRSRSEKYKNLCLSIVCEKESFQKYLPIHVLQEMQKMSRP